jgi:formate dehydrogenase subunit gamma
MSRKLFSKAGQLVAAVSITAIVSGTFLVSHAQTGTSSPPAPASATPAPVAAPAADAPAVATAPAAKAPALPAGSTAQPGWNVPPKWSEVEMKRQYASVPGQEVNVLVEDRGHWWRAIRNGPVTFYGGLLLLIVPLLLLAFFFVKGPFRLHNSPTGRLIERFNSAERMVHWTMALSFVALAISGVIIMFGKYVLMPVIGASAFAWITQGMKGIHNFVGPLFMFSIVVFFIMYVKDNFFKAMDFTWLSKLGGMLSGNHVPSGRFNGGEKVWFWLSIVLLGVAVSASGLILLFPNWNLTRELMAEANLVHGIIAILFVAASLGHIYIGTIGTEGAYKGMREGYVDETWAKEHHALWYEEVKSNDLGKSGKMPNKAAQPAAGDD